MFYPDARITAKTIENSPSPKVNYESDIQSQQNFEPSFDNLNNIMDYSKEKALEYLGDNFEIVPAGAEGLEEGYYFKQYGITLVFEYYEPFNIEFIECNELININDARQGMTFKQITTLLGEGEAFQAQDGEYMGRYYVNYYLSNNFIQFGAPEEDAKTDELIIRRDNMTE